MIYWHGYTPSNVQHNNICFLSTANLFISLFIAGLESAKSKNYEEAFTCFLAAAQQGYSKAQFNTGVCYEKGRGVTMNKEKVWIQTEHFSFWSASSVWTRLEMIFMCFLLKALYYYGQAAVGGHMQAQYRYAKLLLTSRGHQSLEELNTAINLLEQSAAAGLTKVENCHDIFLNFTCHCLFWEWE